MPDFEYTARDLQGQKKVGTISAATEREAINLLSGKSLFPISVSTDEAKRTVYRSKGVKGQVMAATYAQLASLLRSGVPMLRSLAVIREQASNPTLTQILDDIYTAVEDGQPMADAMQRYPRVFSEMAVNMTRAGAEGGFLEDALERVAHFTEQQEDLKSRTIGALAYPVFLGGIGSLIVAALIVFFVPKFGELFETLRERGELPVLTDWLLWLSDTLNRWWWLLLIGIVGSYLVLMERLRSDEGRRTADYWKMKLPLVGNIFQSLAVARFCRVLGTLLNNGVPILKSLGISREAAGNRMLSEAIEEASENISSGASLAKPLASSGYFPKTVVEMIAVAEESNTLDKVLVEIADGLEKRTSRRLDLVVRLLEPLMLLVLAGAVLFVVIALLLPVIKMSSTI
ncbi:MAG: type II secretion system F family protein [Planctomycetaceae bacterium]|jgi:general secretion pathway protein F/type IV pilus assembly protein PilC|nr:type II secretion system F family protein [Planctomycetaceae bacterium]